jgi:hypothetical protein
MTVVSTSRQVPAFFTITAIRRQPSSMPGFAGWMYFHSIKEVIVAHPSRSLNNAHL